MGDLPRLAVTVFDRPEHPRGSRHQLTVAELDLRLRERAHGAHDGSGFSPATYLGNHRSRGRVEAVGMVGLDYDRGVDLDAVAAVYRRKGIAVLGHTTKSHTPSVPRCRLFLPLSAPVDADAYDMVWLAAAHVSRHAGFEPDPQARDASRFWFWPSIPLEGSPLVAGYWGRPVSAGRAIAFGASLEAKERRAEAPSSPPACAPVASIEERARRLLEASEPAVSGQGGHRATFKAACALARGFGLDEATTFAMLRDHYNPRCVPPWSDRDLLHKARQAQRSRLPHGYLLDAERRAS